ncbi:DUF3611 family protein [Altericista sp. CCNU0014]|uniref:DUF3611 family protein n=1 Tax=Altericista sp. CCNU0014 TaxID=3082949 RepID=UPI003850A228
MTTTKNPIDSPPFFPGLRILGYQFKLIGWIGFWLKLVLAIAAIVIVLFASATLGGRPAVPGQPVPTAGAGVGIGIPFLIGGVVCLGISVYWSFFYTRLSRRLVKPTPKGQPSKAETTNWIRAALITDLIGMLLMVIGAESIGGILFSKALSQGVGSFINIDPSRFIQPGDLLVILGSIHGIAGLFIGLSTSLWLLQQTVMQKPPTAPDGAIGRHD